MVYDHYGDQHAAAAGFIRHGLEQNGFCLYVHDETSRESVLEGLSLAGVDHAADMSAGRLVIADRTQSFLPDGTFRANEMLTMLQETARTAVTNGYSGLYATGEMSWALGRHPGVEQLMPYEAGCNHLIEGNEVVGLCQYNRARFDDRALQQVLLTHPWVMVGGRVCRNLYYVAEPDFDLPHFAEHTSVDDLLADIVTRDAVERTLADTASSIEGPMGDSGPDDSRQLAKIYSGLVAFREALLDRAETTARRLPVGSAARSDAAASVSALRGEVLALRQRLEFWQDQLRRGVGLDYDPELRTVHYNGRSVKLSRRESQLIGALLTANGRPVGVRELLHRAWAGSHLSEAQLRSYVVLLRKKLAGLEVPGALVNEPGVGYSLRFDPEVHEDQPRLSVVQSNLA
ncbi:MAG: MEDS domain-containing protein [Candidatus Dormibacteraeota bacterium]|nr:MEDS domain-containing protein [Candidatus Dormibacteraeota bacterium]